MPSITSIRSFLARYLSNRLTLGLAGVTLVVTVSVAGLSNDSDSPDITLPATAPSTVVLLKPSTTTTTTTVPPTETPSTIPTTVPPVTSAPSVAPMVALDPNLPCQEWLPTALEVGWPNDPEVLTMLLKIIRRESGCRPEARSRTSDSGLAQLNDFWCEPSKYYPHPAGWLGHQGLISSCDDLMNPAVNLRSAHAIYLYSLERNGNGWHPWRYSGPTS